MIEPGGSKGVSNGSNDDKEQRGNIAENASLYCRYGTKQIKGVVPWGAVPLHYLYRCQSLSILLCKSPETQQGW